MTANDFQNQLEEFRRGFLSHLPERVSQLEGALKRWQQASDSGSLHEAVSAAHKLAGSGSTFGLPAISDAARALENALGQARDSKGSIDPALRDAIGTAFQQFRLAATNALAAGALPPQSSQLLREAEMQRGPDRLVYLIDHDAPSRDNLATQLGYFGYEARVFTSLDELPPAIEKARPVAIVTEIAFPDGALTGAAGVGYRERARILDTPVIFLSARTDFEARLAAVRAGGVNYFGKPVDVSTLVNVLDSLVPSDLPSPYRVLIVEDDESLAAYYAKLLRRAGLEATFIIDPAHINKALEESRPDLILMDLYMPRCSGVELTLVIRQQEAYFGTPIVFLSSEANPDKHLLAFWQGGDDFLVKPVDPNYLVSVVTSRAQRSRALRPYMTHDGLTGLLNHTKLKERLETEILRSRRYGHQLAYAMIDLDRFKQVNDSHGHAAGDQVLRSLSRMLSQRLRRTDIAGRYGGEEFGVVLTETNAREAEKVLQTICREFAAIRHGSGPEAFTVTLSCGVAEFQPHDSLESLSTAADAALYEAKRGGRNRIVIARRIDTVTAHSRA